MEARKNRNVNMLKLLLICIFWNASMARIHHLKLEEDTRKQITVSTFGFLAGGTLAVNVTSFSYKTDHLKNSSNQTLTLFGFTLDKSKSSALSSYMEGMQQDCIFNSPNIKNENNMESVFFKFDFKNGRLSIERYGTGMQKLLVTEQHREDFLIANHLTRRNAESATKNLNTKLTVSQRKRREVSLQGNEVTKAPPMVQQTTLEPPRKEGDSVTTQSGVSTPVVTLDKDATTAKSAEPSNDKDADIDTEEPVTTSVALNKLSEPDKSVQTYFLVYIRKPQEEGLYNLFFHNCLNYGKTGSAAVDLTMDITEDNNGNFLTAGQMPVPVLYFTFCVLYFIAGVAWLSVLRKSQETVYKIHYLMLVVIFVKSLACLFHGVNMYFIQTTGIHEDAWAILWYIVYLTRGALMLVTMLLIGSGWAFIKHVLTQREKKLFLVIIPLQMLNGVAEVIVEESEEGNQSYGTWKEIFILVDLLCCGAVLFPVVWSIRHLQEASRTDGKAAINLLKLKLFRHFYIMVVCYIYFTRIIVYLMKITLPFKQDWLTDLFTELAMLLFFSVTGYKFRPATDNPYLQVPQESDDEIEMEEVLTKTGDTEQVVRVNQKSTTSSTEGSTSVNQIKQRESSHEYD